MFRDRPLRGHGFGQFPLKNRAYLSDRSTPMRLETIRGYINHNTFLSVLVDLGLIGLLLFLAMLASWIRAGWRLWRDSEAPDWVRAHGLLMLAALVPYFCQMMFREVSYSPMENAPLFLLAGVTLGLRQLVAQPRTATDHPPVGYQPPEAALLPG
jgi:O-antigen ligase